MALKRLISEHRMERLRAPGRCWWCYEPFTGPSHQRYCQKTCREKAYLARRAAQKAAA